MHDTDEHYFDVRQAQDRRMEYIQKKDSISYSHVRLEDGICMKKQQAKGISTKLEEMKARHHMNMQPISLYQVKSVSS